MNVHQPMPDRTALASFLDAVFRHADPDTYVALRSYPDQGREEPACIIREGRVGDPRLAEWTFNIAKQTAEWPTPAVFCPPTSSFFPGKKADQAHLANGLALSVECDSTPEKARRDLTALLGEPTITVASGGVWTDPETGEVEPKLHLHWRLTEPTRDEVDHARLKRARKLACAFVGADATAISLVHPLRWPGSVHRKGSPKLARIVAQTENEVELSEVLEILEAACPAEPERKPGKLWSTLMQGAESDALAGDLLDVAAALAAIPNSDLEWADWNKVGMAAWKATDGRGFAAFDAWSQKSPKYDAEATTGRWEHYSTSPPERIGAGTLFMLAAEAVPGWRRPTLLAKDAQRGKTNGIGSDERSSSTENSAGGSQPDDDRPGAKRADAGEAKSNSQEKPAVLNDRGVMMGAYRDRLEIALRPEAAPAFPVDALPTLMADMVTAMEDRIQAPVTLCAHSVLSAAVLACQGLADIRKPDSGRPMPLSLFLLVVAASGERKSSCDGLALKAVSAVEARFKETYADDMRRYRADKAAFDGEVSKVKSDRKIDKDERQQRLRAMDEPTEPAAPFLRATEATYEGLLNFLAKGRASIGVFSAEGGSFLGGHGMSDDAKTRTLTGLSTLYDDGSAQRIRAKEITIIDGHRVSISLAAQARIAAALLGDELAKDQGFLGRFLVCYPDSRIGTREVRRAAEGSDPRIDAFTARVARLLALQEGDHAPLLLPALDLDDEAWEVFRAFAQAIESNLGEGKQWHPIQAAAQRLPENVCRIAGVLHLFAHGATNKPIDGDTMASACEVGAFYLKEALRVSGGVMLDAETQAANDLATWIEGRPGDLIAPSMVQRLAPYALRMNAAKTRERIRVLCEAGRLEAIGEGTIDGKHFREVYRVNRTGKH